MIAPYVKDYFLPIICVSSICKALCGISAGATNAVIAQHWGDRHGNIADVLSKNGAQHTLVSLLGLALSVKFARLATSSPKALWVIYCVLTTIHFYANYKLMKVLALSTLNRTRYDMLVQRFVNLMVKERLATSNSTHLAAQAIKLLENNQRWFAVDEIARSEPILLQLIPRRMILLLNCIRLKLRSLRHAITRAPTQWEHQSGQLVSDEAFKITSKTVELWVPPSMILSILSPSSLACQLETSRRTGCKYIIVSPNDENRPMYVCFQYDANGEEQAWAHFEASLHQCAMYSTMSSAVATTLFPIFWNFLTKLGWKTSLPILKPKNARGYDSESLP